MCFEHVFLRDFQQIRDTARFFEVLQTSLFKKPPILKESFFCGYILRLSRNLIY